MRDRGVAASSQATRAITRRRFLGAAASLGCMAAAATLTARERRPPFFAGHDLPLGLQLYTLGDAPYHDLDGTLAALARIGYRTVETVGLMRRTASELRAALDRAGLSCPSAHVALQTDGSGGPTLAGDTGRLAADMHRLGVEYVVVPIFPIPPRLGGPRQGEAGPEFLGRAGRAMTADDWRRIAVELNGKAAALAREGLKLAYHNHNAEFDRQGSKSGYDLLLESTDPATVWFEMDVGWVAAAGIDPLPLLQAHPGRFRLMHVKDLKASTVPNTAFRMDPADVGSGSLDWNAILPAAYRAGVRDFYVEQEPPFAGPRMEAARADYVYLADLR
ncbi:MAG TPA: sugar phosphate isomerase/epimerase [Steroidobacteraceae bacterium]|nr:sugar phosphate isomerase/epimerase [Steroidobacteraceae bacterium]